VHELDPGGALGLWAAPRADESLGDERRLEPLVVHEFVEDVGDGGLEDQVDRALVVAEQIFDLGPVGRLADPRVALAATKLDP